MDDRVEGYASGIFELANAEGELERVEDEMFTVARALEGSAELRSTLSDPQLLFDRKRAVIDDLIGGRASTLTVSLVELIVNQGRAADLADIARAVTEASAASRDKAVAEVRSAVPLDQETVDRLAGALGKATGKRVDVKVIVDPSVIGGLVARVGDTVIDGSVAAKFDSLRQTVKSR